MPADPITTVKRELIVRQLESWTPAAAHRSRRATFAQAYGESDRGTADAALRVLGEYADLLRGHRLTAVVLAPPADDLAVRLGPVQAGLPGEVSVHLVPGDAERLPVVLRAAGAAGAPLLAYLDVPAGSVPDPAVLAAVATGRPAELLLALSGGQRVGFDCRRVLPEAGFPLVTAVELVADKGDEAELLVFATGSGKRLDAFKDAMWAVDEYAGVRYRDPADPEGHLLDISLSPHPGPLRRELLAHLAAVGPQTVTELRQFTAARTVYRPADANRVLAALLTSGLVAREPDSGRLSGDVVITRTTP